LASFQGCRPDLLERSREVEFVVELLHAPDRIGETDLRFRGDVTIAVLIDHRQRPADEVAETVRQVRVVAADERVVAERAVFAEARFTKEVIAKGVDAHHVDDGRSPHDVPARLAHLVVFKQQPAVREDALRQRIAGGHQERRPEDRVEADDLLADQVKIGRPQIVAFDGALVRGERVEPDVEYMVSLDR
jgi:hypothetical protein